MSFGWLKKKKVYIPLIIIILIIILVVVFGGDGGPVYETATVERGDLIEEVSVTGQVRSAESVDLAFERGGKVKSILVSVGDLVRSNQTLSVLDDSSLYASLKQAEADVAVAQATLDELESGTRPEELILYKTKVANAETSLSEADQSLVNYIRDSYVKSDGAIRGKADQLFSAPQSSSPRLNITTGSNLVSEVENKRFVIEGRLSEMADSMVKEPETLEGLALSVENDLEYFESFLADLAIIISGLTANVDYSQTSIDSWRADINVARTNVSSALTNLQAAEEKYATAKSSLTVAQNELEIKKAGSTPEALRAQKARVLSAQAKLSSAQASFNQVYLRAPFEGIVSKKNISAGEIVSAGEIAISMISSAEYEIEAFIPEVDIAKVKKGNLAIITLDAYDDKDIFKAVVSEIDPAETVIEGVSTYKIKLQFAEKDERIRPGMTADIEIITETRKDALKIPIRAVIRKNGDEIVRIISGEEIEEIIVETGIRGRDSDIEILSGLDAGDEVVTAIKNGK